MFDWDDANRKHVAEHGVEPSEAEEVIANNPLDIEEQFRNGEDRLMQIGETDALRILVVVTTWRRGKIRVVTAFPAPSQLRRFYDTHKGMSDEGKEITDS
jgi:uncharacterized DUF497 family protein